MNQYMLIAKGREQVSQFANSGERESFMKRFNEWTEELVEMKLFIQADKLSKKLKSVQGSEKGVKILDGPFTETKEAITGYFLIHGESIEQATEIAKSCPVLRFDDIEIYEIHGEAKQ